MTDGRNEWYKSMINVFLASDTRKQREYGDYLRKYFDESISSFDGKNYQTRLNTEPMPFNVYFFE